MTIEENQVANPDSDFPGSMELTSDEGLSSEINSESLSLLESSSDDDSVAE